MPRIKKPVVTEQTEEQPIICQEQKLSTITPDKIDKQKFKQLHIKDTYWLENDIYQTIADITLGKKGAKALIINKLLKDYLKKNKIEIKPFRTKDNKN